VLEQLDAGGEVCMTCSKWSAGDVEGGFGACEKCELDDLADDEVLCV
jgi:hypothetical protein